MAACLEQSGRAVEHVDLCGIQNFEQAIGDHADNSNAEIFGLTATTPQMPAAKKIVAAIRHARPDARIMLGGPHITLVNAAVKRERKIGLNGRATRAMSELFNLFDVLVAGDGEDAIFEAIQPDARFVDADNPKSTLFLTNERLNELPWPARHLVDVSSYHYSIEGVRASSMIAQLGCPFGCNFCSGRDSPMLRRIRMRSTENVVAEIRHLHDAHGFSAVMLYDDETNVNPQMIPLMNSIADLGKEIGVDFRLRGFIKSQLFTDAQADAMYRAGFRWILVGFESGDDRILININKKATRAENTRCVEIARRHGLKVKALMSVGHAGESEATVNSTRDWLLEQKPDDFDVTIITTYPGSPYYDQAIRNRSFQGSVYTYTHPKNGDRLHSHEVDFTEVADYYKGAVGDYHSYVFTDHLSADDLVRLRDGVETEVRAKLNIPFNPSAAAMRYEHSMGQSGLPPFILKKSA